MSIVYLHGGNLAPNGNKGDQLMLLAVEDVVSQTLGAFKKAIRISAGPYQARAARGYGHLLWPRNVRRLSGTLGHWALARYRRPFGIVLEREIDVLLNFMGYRYFDIGVKETRNDADQVERLNKSAKVIFLPQAYGPFSSEGLRKDAMRLFQRADLIYARDSISRRHLIELMGKEFQVEVVPDITLSIAGKAPEYSFDEGQVAVVPNIWMLQRVSREDSEAYVVFLKKVADNLDRLGVPWFFLNHAPFQDKVIQQELEKIFDKSLPIVEEPDPLVVKWLLGKSLFVVGSRYHALVNGLSQNVPVLATSWSHKYEGLMEEYGCAKFLVSPKLSEENLCSLLEELVDDSYQVKVKRILDDKNHVSKLKLEAMWSEVISLIRS